MFQHVNQLLLLSASSCHDCLINGREVKFIYSSLACEVGVSLITKQM